MFYSDGSWNAVTESIDATHNSEDNTGQNESGQPADVLDLTQIDDTMDDVPTYETEKPSSTAHGSQMSNSYCDYWSGILMSTFGLSNVQPSEQYAGVPLTSSDRLVAEAFNQSGNSSTSNGAFPSIRKPNAVMPTSSLQWGSSSTNDMNSYSQNGLSAASQISPTASNLTTTRSIKRFKSAATSDDGQLQIESRNEPISRHDPTKCL